MRKVARIKWNESVLDSIRFFACFDLLFEIILPLLSSKLNTYDFLIHFYGVKKKQKEDKLNE